MIRRWLPCAIRGLVPLGMNRFIDGEERVVAVASATKVILQKPGKLTDLLELPGDDLSRIEKRIF